jgi:hypothetical protein
LDDSRVFIIGGGASVKDVLADPILKGLLEKEYIIGCNVAPKFIRCDAFLFFDDDFENRHRTMIDNFTGLIYAPDTAQRKWSSEKIIFKEATLQPSTNIKNGIYFGGNAGCGALSLALSLGMQNIYLIGFNLRHDKDGNKNYHKEYAYKEKKAKIISSGRGYERMIWTFERIINFKKEKLPNITVWNCSRKSRLLRADFPYISLDKVLNG